MHRYLYRSGVKKNFPGMVGDSEMKSVLASIKPKYCELIASGEKTVEIRKTRPKLNTPFKVYMYCTRGKDTLWKTQDGFYVSDWWEGENDIGCVGKVIGEFVCDEIGTYEIEYPSRIENVFRAIYRHIEDEGGEEYSFIEASNDMTDDELSNSRLLSQSQLTLDEIGEYVCGKKQSFNSFYAWHISDLVIYDKPRELGEFYRLCSEWKSKHKAKCKHCPEYYIGYGDFCGTCLENEKIPITRPPQSWCYVEED